MKPIQPNPSGNNSKIAIPAVIVALTLTALSITGCVAPTSNAGYFAMDPAQAEANRQNIWRIQQQDRKYDDAERISQAHAIEIATRHTGLWWW